MNKSKTKKLVLLTTVAILLLAFIPAVQAKTTKRSIEDWFVRDLGMNPHILGWANDADLAIWPHNFPGWLVEPLVPIWDCLSFDGYVLEREVKGNKLAVTVSLHVTGVPFTLTQWIWFDPLPIVPPFGYQWPIFTGTMHYTFRVNFILDLDEYYDEFIEVNEYFRTYIFEIYPEDEINYGELQYMPLFIYLFGWLPLSCEVGSVHFNGAGTGIFTEEYDGWEVDDSAKVRVNEIGMFDKDFEEGHPNYYYDPEFPSFWPVEFIFFH